MKNYYSTVNNIVLTHSDMMYENCNRKVTVRFERSIEKGFDFAEGILPECMFNKTSGFSEDELFELSDYLKCNAILIWDYAQKGESQSA
ncbi:hypothetical protein FACS1894141_0020 [Spirochaetia bacterium]|nr:hypothetical protein FACS1894141_0020 [Spirochaetia bacterium]